MKPITKCNHEANKELCDDCIAKNERVSNRIHGLVECQRENEYLKGVVKRLASMNGGTKHGNGRAKRTNTPTGKISKDCASARD